ncbi:UNVERIFIED_CONTAM: hypothetical protein H355_006159 [Colinus virginianus]|nr:hypothetical protein H355_006159 [Colinus virginianus]
MHNLEVKKIPAVKAHGAGTFSVTRFHISEPYVDREMNGEQWAKPAIVCQPDARVVAEEEVKRLEELHRELERERREQLEKAHLRGSHALKKVYLAQDREKLLKELEQMQSMDRMRRRQMVVQMPPQLFVPGYKRVEMKEDWQRELEFAFEDMYSEDRKMKGDLILQFEPQPLPSPCDRSQDNDLDLSLEQEAVRESQQESGQMVEVVPDESEKSVEMLEHKVAPESSIVIHPQEQAAKIRMENERQQWLEQLEQQKQEQLALLKQIEEEKAHLEIQMQTCLEGAKNKKEGEERSQPAQSCSVPSSDEQKKAELGVKDCGKERLGSGSTAVPETTSPGEDSHLQMIRNYQQRLLQQSRLHKQAVSEARSHLHEYQNKLMQRYLTDPVKILSSMETTSVNLKLDSEPLLQRQRMQPAQYQSPGRAGEDSTLSPPHAYNICNVALNASSEKHGEKAHRVCPGKHTHSLEPSHLKLGKFYLPQSCSSQGQARVLQTSSNEIREPALFQLPSALATRDVSATRTPLEARVQQVRFALPAQDSSEASETEHLKESPLMSNQQMETEAEEEPPPMAPLLSTAKGSPVAQAATADSLACQQGSAESPTRASLEPGTLSGPMSLSREGGVEEFLVSKSGDASLLNYSSILDLRDRLWASSESIQAQQQYLKELQEQLDAHREALLSRQKIQEQLLTQKQDRLKEQMQKQQEALKEFLNKQVSFVSASHGVSLLGDETLE